MASLKSYTDYDNILGDVMSDFSYMHKFWTTEISKLSKAR